MIHLFGAKVPVMKSEIFAVAFLTASAPLASPAFASASPEPSKGPQASIEQPAMKLNPTGRTYEIEVPVKVDGARLGDIAIKITPDDKIFVDGKLLKTYLGKIVKEEVLTAALAVPAEGATQVASEAVVGKKGPGASSSLVQLASQQKEPEPGQLGQEPRSYLAMETIKQRGIVMSYDPLNTELAVQPTVDQRPTVEISLGQRVASESKTLEQPAHVSAYLNMRMAASYVSQSTGGSSGVQAPSIDFDGAVRIGPVVLEGEGTFYTGNASGFAQTYFQDYVFYRRGTRLVYDWPDEAIRFRLGDVTPAFSGFQTSTDLFGLSAEKSYSQLQPGRSVVPTGAHSFRLERPSMVDIIVNEALVRRVRLGPGTYNLSDLPLGAGANNVKLGITDDTGAQQTLQFNDYAGGQLAPGLSEWSLSAGIKSYDQGIVDFATSQSFTNQINSIALKTNPSPSLYGQRSYCFNQPAMAGFYRTGITNALTGDANVQADDQAAMIGGGLVTETNFGAFTGEIAGSEAYSGRPGYAIHLGYGYDKFDWFGSYKSGLRFVGEYKSPDFGMFGAVGGAPIQNDNTLVAASYTQQLPYDVSAGLSFSYNAVDHSAASRGLDSWDGAFTLSSRLWDTISGSLSVGYSGGQAASASSVSNQNGLQAFVRLIWVPDAYSSAMLAYDSRTQTAQATYTRSSETTGVGSWTSTVDAETQAKGQSAVNASASYVANRADVTVTHSAALSGIGYDAPFNPASTGETTSVGIATSFVYADGAWGVGRPVNGGFALVTAHPSLGGSPVVVGGTDLLVAQSDWFGSAVVPSASPYKQTRLNYDAPEAPTGYDLGTAAFEMNAPYKAGYKLQAGSAYTVTAMGTLLDAHGEPLPLLAGEAREANKENGRKVEMFTNRVGRFGAMGLAPGKWLIEMPTEGDPTHYVIEIPEGVNGLHDAGTLKPDGTAGQQKPPVIEAKAEAETDNGTN